MERPSRCLVCSVVLGLILSACSGGDDDATDVDDQAAVATSAEPTSTISTTAITFNDATTPTTNESRSIAVDEAATRLGAILVAASTRADPLGEDIQLADCPLTSLHTLPFTVDGFTVTREDLSARIKNNSGTPIAIQCSVGTSDHQIVLAASAAPTGLFDDQIANDFANGGTIPASVTALPLSDQDGGVLHPVCELPETDDTRPSCVTYWVSGPLMILLASIGSSDPAEVTGWLAHMLTDVVSTLAATSVDEIVLAASAAQDSVPPVESVPTGEAASSGPTADEIRTAQRALNSLGYGPLDEDGILGPASTAALSDFQADAGLPSTGLLDQASLEALETAAAAQPESQTLSALPLPEPDACSAVELFEIEDVNGWDEADYDSAPLLVFGLDVESGSIDLVRSRGQGIVYFIRNWAVVETKQLYNADGIQTLDALYRSPVQTWVAATNAWTSLSTEGFLLEGCTVGAGPFDWG